MFGQGREGFCNHKPFIKVISPCNSFCTTDVLLELFKAFVKVQRGKRVWKYRVFFIVFFLAIYEICTRVLFID